MSTTFPTTFPLIIPSMTFSMMFLINSDPLAQKENQFLVCNWAMVLKISLKLLSW